MKFIRTTTALSLFLLSTILAGCPISSNYPLAAQDDALPRDNSLLGHWITNKKEAEATEVTVEKGKEKNTYKVKVIEKGDMFSSGTTDFSGWLTEIKGLRMLVLKETGSGADNKSPYYVYAISETNNQLTIKDISLKVNGVDAIKSINDYREEVALSMDQDDFFGDETVYRKK